MLEENFNDIVSVLPARERMIAKQAHFYSIIFNAKNNSQYVDLPISSIILATLEFLTIEGNLKNRGILYSEVQDFIKKLLQEGFNIEISGERLSDFTHYLFKRLSNNGSAFEYEYFNPDSNTTEVVTTRYITSKVDAYNRGLLVHITFEGMELLLNTKEVADEYKISVHVLLLQKMISTNNLEDVLRGVKNLNAEIKKQIHKKQELIELLQYAPENKFNEYIDYIKATSNILREDSEQLNLTKESIKKYEDDLLNNIGKKDLSEEQKEIITNQIKKIDLELDICVGNHQSLLEETVRFIQEIPTIQKNRLIRLLSSNFNIEDKMNTLVKNNCASALRYIIQPLLKPNIKKIFNLNKIDAMFTYKPRIQIIEADEVRDENNLGIATTFDMEIDETMKDNYIFYMRNLLVFAKEQGNSDLKTFLEYLRELHGTMPINNSDIRGFIYELTKERLKEDSYDDVTEYSYDNIIIKDHKSNIEKIFIEVIQDYEGVDFMKNKLTLAVDDTSSVNISDFIILKNNITLTCEMI